MENKIQKAADFDTLSPEEKHKVNGFTEEQYKELKAKYGNRLRMVTVETEDGRYDYLIIRPSRAHMMLVANKGKDGDYEAANAVLINNCVVAGDRDVLDEDYAVYSAVMQAMKELTEAAQAFIRKA
jgi:hypothetical protein